MNWAEEYRRNPWAFADGREDLERRKAYWLSKTPEERLAAMEFMRQMAYGYDDPEAIRMVKTLEVVYRED